MLVVTRNDLLDVYVWIKAFPFKGQGYDKVIGFSFLGRWLARWNIAAPYCYYPDNVCLVANDNFRSPNAFVKNASVPNNFIKIYKAL